MKKEKRVAGLSRNDKIFTILNYIFLSICAIIVLYPLIYVVSSSFSSSSAVITGRVWLFPVEPSLLGYTTILQDPTIITGYINSVFYTFFGTVVNIFLTLLAAYPLSRKGFFGRNFFMALFVFTMLFSGGLIPTYILVNDLGLYDSRLAMIIPNALNVWNVIIARTYFVTSIPAELYEAGEVDGCSDIGFIGKVILPLSKPILAVLVLFYAVAHWNSYFQALIYLRDPNLYPLQIILRNILIQNQIQETMIHNVEAIMRYQGLAELLKYSLIVVASLPVLILYPFVQKYFIKGIMIGAIKG